jgi:hypothetical protein
MITNPKPNEVYVYANVGKTFDVYIQGFLIIQGLKRESLEKACAYAMKYYWAEFASEGASV